MFAPMWSSDRALADQGERIAALQTMIEALDESAAAERERALERHQEIMNLLSSEDSRRASNLSRWRGHSQCSTSSPAEDAEEPETPKRTTTRSNHISARACSRDSLRIVSKQAATSQTSFWIRGQLTASSIRTSFTLHSWAFQWFDFLVKHSYFELIITLLIAGNACIMCFQVQMDGRQLGHKIKFPHYEVGSGDPEADFATFFDTCDWFFGTVFIIECVLKVLVYHRKYFCNAWNAIDFACVFAFILDKVATAVLPVNANAVRLIRLFRLLRLIKVIQSLENMDVLHLMTTAIRGMGSVLMWAFILLSVVLTACALLLTQILHTTYFTDDYIATLSGDELQRSARLFEYFGTFTRCVFSMFELTLANWPPVARMLAEDVSESFFAICIIHKVVIGFAVVAVINAIVLQETFKVASSDDMLMLREKKRQRRNLRKKLGAFFYALDADQDGDIDLDEFRQIARLPEIMDWLESLDFRTDDVDQLFNFCDVNGDGTISHEEFMSMLPRLREPTRMLDFWEFQGFMRNLIQESLQSIRQGAPKQPCARRSPDLDDQAQKAPYVPYVPYREDTDGFADDAMPSERSVAAPSGPDAMTSERSVVALGDHDALSSEGSNAAPSRHEDAEFQI
eukprot:TRINITY_DN74489_c0_g1_i1.p1 TRINITY_DN74489_c0_g1~~TRINITY_DN74489_c0_g1_i1.p1  ORF type:complete len:641 (-),score=61.99 TRINITY_DN74489_c0_g1_i1:220-2100(-)